MSNYQSRFAHRGASGLLFSCYKTKSSCSPLSCPAYRSLPSSLVSCDMADQWKADSFMAVDVVSSQTPQPQILTLLFKAQHILRGLAVVFTAVSIALLVTNSQTVTVLTIQLQAHFYYSSAFKFLVAADAIVCASSAAILIVVIRMMKRGASAVPQRRQYRFLLFLHDTVMMVMMMAGCAAGTAIGYVGQYGESHMGWDPICDKVAKFCRINVVSLLFSYSAFFAYLGLTLLAPYNFLSSSPILPPPN